MNHTLISIQQLIADDGYATTFQTMGQYRSALLTAIAAQRPQDGYEHVAYVLQQTNDNGERQTLHFCEPEGAGAFSVYRCVRHQPDKAIRNPLTGAEAGVVGARIEAEHRLREIIAAILLEIDDGGVTKETLKTAYEAVYKPYDFAPSDAPAQQEEGLQIAETAFAALIDSLRPAFDYVGVSLRISQEDHAAIRSAMAGASTGLQLLRNFRAALPPSAPATHSGERTAFEAALHSYLGNAMLYRVDMKGSDRFGQYCRQAVEDCWQLWQVRAALAAAKPEGEQHGE